MAIMCAALRGMNIPGGLWFDEASVRTALQHLPPTMTFLRSVGRPASILDQSRRHGDRRRGAL
jgi:hypothetical protein